MAERDKNKEGKKPKTPETEDEALWRSAMQDVRPIKKEEPSSSEEPEAPAGPADREADVPPATPTQPPDESKAPPPAAGIDRRTEEKLRQGRFRIEGTLDLHGHSKIQAHDELARFIEAGYEAGRRCLLVITGKGGGVRQDAEHFFEPETGVLKRQVPQWLNEPPLAAKVIAFTPAQPKHGGDGALYVYLRRKKKGR